MTHYRLDVAKLGDLDALVSVALESGEASWHADTFYPSCRGDSNEIAFVQREQDHIVGYAVMAKEYDVGALYSLAVLPAHRGHGLARSLLGEGLNWLKSRGLTRCLLEVRVTNVPAIALYESIGFARDGIRKNYYPTPGAQRADALLMSLEMNKL